MGLQTGACIPAYRNTLEGPASKWQAEKMKMGFGWRSKSAWGANNPQAERYPEGPATILHAEPILILSFVSQFNNWQAEQIFHAAVWDILRGAGERV